MNPSIKNENHDSSCCFQKKNCTQLKRIRLRHEMRYTCRLRDEFSHHPLRLESGSGRNIWPDPYSHPFCTVHLKQVYFTNKLPLSVRYHTSIDPSLISVASHTRKTWKIASKGNRTSSFSVSLLRSCFSQVRYRAEWSNESAFRSILISPKMLMDHMPDAVLRALNSLTSERPFSLCPSAVNVSQYNTVWNTPCRDALLILCVKVVSSTSLTLYHPHSHHKDFGAKPDFKASQAFTLERHCEIWNRRDLAVNHVLVGAQRAIC